MNHPTIKSFYAKSSGRNINAIAVSKNGMSIGIAQDSHKSRPTLTIVSADEVNNIKVIEKSEGIYNRVTDVIFLDDDIILYTLINAQNKVDFKTNNIQTNEQIILDTIERPNGPVTINAFRNVCLLIDKKIRLLDLPSRTISRNSYSLPDGINHEDVYENIKIVYFGGKDIIVAGLKESTAQVWNVEKKTWGKQYEGNFYIASKIQVTDRWLFLTEMFGNGLFRWNIDDTSPANFMDFNNPEVVVTAFDVSDTIEWVAIGNHTGYLQILNMKDNLTIFEGRVIKGKITAVCINSVRKQVYVAGTDASITVIEL